MNGTMLVAHDGDLYYPRAAIKDTAFEELFSELCSGFAPDDGSVIIVHRYPDGDADTIPWPMVRDRDKWLRALRAAIFDDRETGLIGDQQFFLPDGTEI